ncbi:unnamed protein product [Orchesella dallaii]|uniref:CCHC-type domain-containing protein n=1 Tax=Orchesella dallaii TaxID=48710 RepID=A0ABP1R4Q1_9HEXA
MQPGEAVDTYLYDVIRLCKLVDANMTEARKIHYVTKGLLPVLFYQVMARDFRSVNDLRQHLHRLEDARHTFGEDSPYFEMINQSSTKTSAMETQMKSLQDMMTKLTTVVSVNAVQAATTPRPPPAQSIPQHPPRQYTSNPTPAPPTPPYRTSRFPARTPDGQWICFNCNLVGHSASHCQNDPFCPKPLPSKSSPLTIPHPRPLTHPTANIPTLANIGPTLPIPPGVIYCSGSVYHSPCKILVDTGACASFISASLFPGPYLPCLTTTVKAANGSTMPLLGKALIPLVIEKTSFTRSFYVLQSSPYPVILGTDFLTTNSAVIQYPTKTLCLNENTFPFHILPKPSYTLLTCVDTPLKIRNAETVTVPAKSVLRVKVKLPPLPNPCPLLLVESTPQLFNKYGLCLSNFVADLNTSEATSINELLLANRDNYPKLLPRGLVLASIGSC